MTTETVTAANPGQTSIRLGPFDVDTDVADVIGFSAALDQPPLFGSVPLTFPVRWLSLPELRGGLLDWLDINEDDIVLLSQSIDYCGPIEKDHKYAMDVEVCRNRSPIDETRLVSTVRHRNGTVVVLLDTLLRRLITRPTRQPTRRLPAVLNDALFTLNIKPVDLAQTRRYAAASLDYNPLHTDASFARAMGLSDIVAHGTMIMGQFERAIINWRRDLHVDRLQATFLQPLLAGMSTVLNGRLVKSMRTGDAEISILRLIVTTERGEVTCVGEATVRLGT